MMNEPKALKEIHDIRLKIYEEIHDIRLKIYEETKDMTPEQRATRTNKAAEEFERKHGFTLRRPGDPPIQKIV